MPSQSVVAALFADIFARCGESSAPDDLEPFALSAGDAEPITVHYDAEEQTLWLTSDFEPIGGHDVHQILQCLLLHNLRGIENGYACALDPVSAVPILQSCSTRSLLSLPDFELMVERHIAAIGHVREFLSAPNSRTLPPVSETACRESGSPRRSVELLSELSPLVGLERIPQVPDSYWLPHHLSGAEARVELTACDDELRLRAVLGGASAHTTAACLCMLDWNLFASCGGGQFAIDEHGAALLIRRIPCDAQTDSDAVQRQITHFNVAVQPFFEVLRTHSAGGRGFDPI